MNLEEVSALCSSFQGVTESIKWEDHLCFCVGEKMFFIASLSNVPTTASFKASPDSFEQLSVIEGCKPAPYMGRYKWIHVDDLNRFSLNQWEELISASYQLVASKLSKKLRTELNINL